MVTLVNTASTEPAFRGSGIRGFRADRSANTAVKGLATAAQGFATLAEESNQQDVFSKLSSDLEDASASASSLDIVGGSPQQQLDPEDTNIINQIKREKQRIDLQVEQGTTKDRAARLQRLSIANAAVNTNPHLFAEINQIFGSKSGRSIGAEALALREEGLASAVAEQERQEQAIRDTSKANGIPTSLPLSSQLEMQRPFVESGMRLEILKRKNELASEGEKANTRGNDIKIQEQLPDLIRIVAGSVKGISEGLDIRTSDPEAIRQAIGQLQNLKLGILADGQKQYGLTHTPEQLAAAGQSAFEIIDNRIAWLNGSMDKTLVENAEAAITGTADNKLLQQPGVSDLLAKMKALKGVSQLISNIPALASEIKLKSLARPAQDLANRLSGAEVALPDPTAENGNWFDRMLNTAGAKLGADSYETIESTAGPQAAIDHIKAFSYAVQSNFDNVETSGLLLDAMTKYTNGWKTGSDTIPMEVYDSMLDVVSNEQWVKFRNSSAVGNLPDNLKSGFDTALQRMRNSLAEDIGDTLRIPFDVQSLDGQLLIGEAIEVQIDPKDGFISFRQKPALNNDANVFKLVTSLNRNYGTFFGKLARSYAHEVQGDTDYAAAGAAILSTGEFRRAGELAPGQQAAAPTQEEVQVWVRDENGNLTQERK